MSTYYTIKDASGTIHKFKTLKAARASTIGYSFKGGLRIIAQVKTAAKKRGAADAFSAATSN